MRRYRSVFISDVHLGTADCQADYLLDFLNQVHCQTLYLVGDIIDLIAMQRRVHFPDAHRAVIHKLMELASSGTRVIYVPGNHDLPKPDGGPGNVDFCSANVGGLVVAGIGGAGPARFGFPYILAIKGRHREQILENFRARVENDPEAEFEEAIEQVRRIALLRLEAMAEG